MQAIGLAFIIFVFIIAITSLVFGGWVIVTLFKGVGQFLGWVMGRPNRPAVGPMLVQRPMPLPTPVFGNRTPVPFSPPIAPPTAAIETIEEISAQSCSFPRCKAANPVAARFCRRCGRQLQKPAAMVRERMAG
jgi:ribosomal protein L40E